MGIFSGVLIVAVLILSIFQIRKQHKESMIPERDSDMKIAPESFSGGGLHDTSEIDAREFIKEKASGNIERAVALGEKFASAALDNRKGLVAKETSGKTEPLTHQIFLLYSYVVTRVIAKFSPNSILAQTTLNTFYREIETNSPDISEYFNDMAGFSLYILCERNNENCDKNDIGAIFARLCKHTGETTFLDYGVRIYSKFYLFCEQQVEAARYSDA